MQNKVNKMNAKIAKSDPLDVYQVGHRMRFVNNMPYGECAGV